MIEAKSNLDALISRLVRLAARKSHDLPTRQRAARSRRASDWRSASDLWPGFVQD